MEDLWSDEKKVVGSAVYAKGNYSYVLEKPEGSKTNQLYSWGMGENYVLGSRDDDNQFRPYAVHPRMFEELPVLMLGAGTQHVVVLTSDSQDHQNFPQFTREVLEFKIPLPEPKPKNVPVARKPKAIAKIEAENHEMEEEKEGHIPLKEEEEVQLETIPTKIIDATKKRKSSEFEGTPTPSKD